MTLSNEQLFDGVIHIAYDPAWLEGWMHSNSSSFQDTFSAWRKRWPGIFRKEDLTAFENQRTLKKHFPECVAAIWLAHVFRESEILIEQYPCLTHPEKRGRLKELCSPALFERLTRNEGSGAPDLMVVPLNWPPYFVEVKASYASGSRDQIDKDKEERQERMISDVRTMEPRVFLARVNPWDGNPMSNWWLASDPPWPKA